MNSRETQARLKREAVENSSAFKMWYSERRNVHPHPADPYQAYQTDKALKARQENLVNWKKAPNQVDIGSVDSPKGHAEIPIFRKAPKPVTRQAPVIKHQSKTEHHRPQGNDPRKRPVEEEIKALAERMSMKYGSPIPTKYSMNITKGVLEANSSMAMQWSGGYMDGGGPSRVIGAELTIGTKRNMSRGIVIGTAAHEFGHLAHAGGSLTALKEAGVKTLYLRNNRQLSHKERYGKEIAAWQLARPFINEIPKKEGERARALWHKRFALETYRRDAETSRIRDERGEVKYGQFKVVFGRHYF